MKMRQYKEKIKMRKQRKYKEKCKLRKKYE